MLESVTGEPRRHVWVYVTDSAFGVTDGLAGVTAAAIESSGRSEVEQELTALSPSERIVLTTLGYGAYPG